MLRGIPPLLTPDLLHALAGMGHGDELAIVDANFPAVSVAARAGVPCVQLVGVDTPAALDAVLTLLPVDDFEPDPVRTMQVVGDPQAVPPAVQAISQVLARHGAPKPAGLERHAFYAAAQHARLIVRTAEMRAYGNVLVRKGVLFGAEPTTAP
jgi:L-fucose mutarotase